MEAEADRYRPVGTGNQGRLHRQVVVPERHRDLQMVTEGKQGEELAAAPLQLGGNPVLTRFRQLPAQAGPRHAVDWQPIPIEVEERGGRIERYLTPRGAIVNAVEPIRPRMQQGNPGTAASRRRAIEVA